MAKATRERAAQTPAARGAVDVVIPNERPSGAKARVTLDAGTADVVRRIARADKTSVTAVVGEMIRLYAAERGWQVRDA